ncbi:MAG: DUF2384 domain-containing protein [bacterium]|nr:DUF2384 domain-containing protein [bacterium]
MARIARNQPCPCGSGKKYKRCCLRAGGPLPEGQAPGRALAWLHEHHEEAMQEAFREDFLGGLQDDELARFKHLPESLWNMLDVNGWEFVLAEGQLELPSGRVSCLDLVFSPGGPLLDAGQREYLEKMRREPLGLYEVVESYPGSGLRLRDLLDDEAPLRWIRELGASESLSAGNVIGARLIPGSPWTFSGAIYSYSQQVALRLQQELRRELAAGKPDQALERELRGGTLADGWLELLTMPAPTLVDASTGEATLLVNDHYRVVDWDGLEAALAAQPDVSGDRRNGWSRLEDPTAEMSRTRLAINLRGEDRIEAFARTRKLADEGKVWFEQLAGDAVAHITREITDPASLWEGRFDKPSGPSGPSGPLIDPSELPDGFHQQLHEQIYRNWADEPVPMLGDRTPRQALETKAGRQQVIDLLESYERNEQAKPKESMVDYGFLWRELALERPRRQSP